MGSDATTVEMIMDITDVRKAALRDVAGVVMRVQDTAAKAGHEDPSVIKPTGHLDLTVIAVLDHQTGLVHHLTVRLGSMDLYTSPDRTDLMDPTVINGQIHLHSDLSSKRNNFSGTVHVRDGVAGKESLQTSAVTNVIAKAAEVTTALEILTAVQKDVEDHIDGAEASRVIVLVDAGHAERDLVTREISIKTL